MRSIRTVLVTMPKMLADVVVTALLKGSAPISVIARLDSRLAIRAQLPALAPDLVLMALRDNEPDGVAAMALRLVPSATLIAFTDCGRNAHVHDTGVPRLVLFDVSSAALVDVVLERRVMNRHGGLSFKWCNE